MAYQRTTLLHLLYDDIPATPRGGSTLSPFLFLISGYPQLMQ